MVDINRERICFLIRQGMFLCRYLLFSWAFMVLYSFGFSVLKMLLHSIGNTKSEG